APPASRRRVTAAPMNPVDPVTSTFMAMFEGSLVVSGGDIAREVAESIGLRVEVLQVLDSGNHAFIRQLPCARHPEEGGIGLFATGSVGMGVFSEFLSGADHVQHIIGDLKREADLLRIGGQILQRYG